MQRVFGGSILLPDGQMDRKAVAALIFNDAAARERYQAIIYPYITRTIRQQAEQLSAAGHRMILLDAPTVDISSTAIREGLLDNPASAMM